MSPPGSGHVSLRTDTTQSCPYQRGGAARGHVGTVTRGHGEMASETSQHQLGQYAVLPLTRIYLGAACWGVFQFASRPAFNFISFRCVGRLARPRYLPGGRASVPFSFGVSFEEGAGPFNHTSAMTIGEAC